VPADPKGVLTGVHFLDGNQAACEGALAAGCRFVAGYPITPAAEIIERFARRIPAVGGVFIQMEDELAASMAMQGAAWGGQKTMAVTSGPGLSLMMETLGYAFITETPGVWVDVQRGGPGTGLPTAPAQGDMQQIKWGSHGDYEIIALCPQSPQECFDFTVRAFNLAETWRVPVFLMMDEAVGHMTERVVIPEAGALEVVARAFAAPGQAPAAGPAPAMARAGDGHRLHVTGHTRDDRGFPSLTAQAQDRLMRRLVGKIRDHAQQLVDLREDGVDGADVVVLSYGIVSRVAQAAVEAARAQGLKVGHARLVIAWPFPDQRIHDLAASAKAILVPELNLGQMVREVQRAAAGATKIISLPHAGGAVFEPGAILDGILEASR